MKTIVILLIGLSMPCLVAQSQLNLEEMEGILLELVDEQRTSEQLSQLERNELLNAVAFDQAAYILKSNKLEHSQDDKKKAKLEDRLLYYEGFYGQSGENIAEIGLGARVQLEKGGTKISAKSPEELMKGVFFDWMSEEETARNIIDPAFKGAGVSVLQKDDGNYIVVLVMVNEPYEAPQGAKLSVKQFGVSPYSKEACDAFIESHGSVASLFSDAFKVENREIIFEFHSLDFINHIIQDGGDAIAIDLIDRQQYACQSSNRLFPGELQDGLLLSPVKKAKLTALNTEIENGKVRASLAKVPAFYNETNYEINAKIIKDGNYCLTIPFNRLETPNTKWSDFPYLKALPDTNHIFSKIDSSEFEFGLDQKELLKKELKSYCDALSKDLYDMSITVDLAPGIDLDQNVFLGEFKQTVGEHFTELSVATCQVETNWEAYENFKKGTYYQLETKDMSKEEELDYLKKTMTSDEELKQKLMELSRVKLNLRMEIKPNQDLSPTELEGLVLYLSKADKIDLALLLQQQMHKAEFNASNLGILKGQDQTKSTLPLINNQILKQLETDKTYFDGNPIHLAFLELYLIDKSNPVIAYNYHMALLHHWSYSNQNVKQIESWEKGFSLIDKNKLNSSTVARAYLNYWMIAGDYYYEKQDFDRRKKAFREIIKWARKAELSQDQLLELSQYLCHQDQFSKAIELLLPELKGNNLSVSLLSYFLQIAIYQPEMVDEATYLDALEMLKSNDERAFCQLFSKSKMGIQQLKNPKIKALYCGQCSN